MKDTAKPQVIAVDRVEGGVLIAFDDGKCALYSSALLYAAYGQATPLSELPGLEVN